MTLSRNEIKRLVKQDRLKPETLEIFDREAKKMKGERKGKYNAKPCTKYGMRFESQGELLCFDRLRALHLPKCCTLRKLERKEAFEISPGIEMLPDFEQTCDVHPPAYHEYKGFSTPVWRLKRKLYASYGTRPLHVWMGRATKFHLAETLCKEGSE